MGKNETKPLPLLLLEDNLSLFSKEKLLEFIISLDTKICLF